MIVSIKNMNHNNFGSRKRKSGAGFTLAEMLIAIAIFCILLALVIVNFNKGKRMNDLKQASAELAQNIRLAQNYTLSGKTLDGNVPEGGYGINIAGSGTYDVFADKNNINNDYLMGEGDAEIIGVTFASKFISDIRFVAMKIGNDDIITPIIPSDYPINITFFPPNGDVYINSSPDTTLYLLLQLGSEKPCRKITVVGATGQVSEGGDSDCNLLTVQ